MRILKQLIIYKFLRFCIVGGLGTITNLALYFIFVDLLFFNYILISICTFLIAATQNYLLNHIWTFKDITINKKTSLNGYLKFLFVSLIGLAFNLIVLKLMLTFFSLPFKVIAQAFGILAGTVINFLGSKFYVFKKYYSS